jgi:ribonuclease HI
MLPKINNFTQKKETTPFKKKIYPEYDYVMKFDGCSKGNPGLAGCGAVIYRLGKEIWSDCLFVGEKVTNNYAEYAGLILGLQNARKLEIKKIKIQGDSQLVINHMKGIYKCNSSNIIELYDSANELDQYFENIEYEHIYRNENKRADHLSNMAVENYLKVNAF